MKIVQSFWTKPIKNSYDKIDGGWMNKKYHYFSWALSCLQLKKHYKEVELYTDDFGKALLIDKLNLPYTKVNLALNNLEPYDTHLWTIGKIYTYMLQENPFIHVDSDIFIWDKFREDMETAHLMAQDLECSFQTYKSYIVDAEQHFKYVPESFKIEKERISTHATCYNTGIIGGTNTTFIKEYASEAMYFIDENFSYVPEKSALQRLFGIFIEQYLCYSMATQRGINANLFVEDYRPFYEKDIRRLAKNQKYVHLVGGRNGGYKIDAMCCGVLENWLKINHAEYYYHILDLLDNHEI